MAENLAGYVTRVRQFLHEATESASTFSDVFIKQIFNDAYRRRCNQLVMAFEGYFTDVATADLVANQSRYSWPPGFERLQKFELVRTDGRTTVIQRAERHYATGNAPVAGGDTYLPSYRPIGSGFVLEPAPQQTTTGAIRIEYIGLPAELVDDGDVLHADFPKSFASLLVYDTVVACIDSEDIMENGVIKTVLRLRGEFEIDWERYIDYRMVSPNNVTPFIGPYGDA